MFMKMVIAGGRDFEGTEEDSIILHEIMNKLHITEIVSGGAMGADNFGERFAKDAELSLTRFPADWKRYGSMAGPRRNRQMAEYTDYVFLFPGGKGTGSMREQALKAGKKIVYDAGWTN